MPHSTGMTTSVPQASHDSWICPDVFLSRTISPRSEARDWRAQEESVNSSGTPKDGPKMRGKSGWCPKVVQNVVQKGGPKMLSKMDVQSLTSLMRFHSSVLKGSWIASVSSPPKMVNPDRSQETGRRFPFFQQSQKWTGPIKWLANPEPNVRVPKKAESNPGYSCITIHSEVELLQFKANGQHA